MIGLAPEIARLAKKFVRPNPLRVPAVPSARAAQPVSVRHDREVVIVRPTTAVHDETIVLAADVVGTAMTGPVTIVLGMNRVVPHHHLRASLQPPRRRGILETSVPASSKSSHNHHRLLQLTPLTHHPLPRVAAGVTNRSLKVRKRRMRCCETHIIRVAVRLTKTSSGPTKILMSNQPRLAASLRPPVCRLPMRRASPTKRWRSPMSKRLKETTSLFAVLAAAAVDVVRDPKRQRHPMATKAPRSI